MRKHLAFAIALALASVFAAASDEEEYNRRAAERSMAMFHEHDYNKDGSVSRDEVGGTIDLQAQFVDIDTDRDGRITLAEMQRYVKARYQMALAR